MQRKAVIVNALRTPVGKMRQSLASVSALTLAAEVMKESIRRAGIDPVQVDEVIFGNLMNYNHGSLAHMSWLAAGLPLEVPGVTVERRCASSLTALSLAVALIESGHAEVVLAGGVESYSQQPFLVKRPEQAYPASLQFWKSSAAPIISATSP